MPYFCSRHFVFNRNLPSKDFSFREGRKEGNHFSSLRVNQWVQFFREEGETMNLDNNEPKIRQMPNTHC